MSTMFVMRAAIALAVLSLLTLSAGFFMDSVHLPNRFYPAIICAGLAFGGGPALWRLVSGV